jgi:hypothetical protein
MPAAVLQKRLFFNIAAIPVGASAAQQQQNQALSPTSGSRPRSPMSPGREDAAGAAGATLIQPQVVLRPEAGELRVTFNVPPRCQGGGIVTIAISVSGRPIPGLPLTVRTPRPGQLWAPAKLPVAAAGNTTPCVGRDGVLYVPVHSTNAVHVFNPDGSQRGQPLLVGRVRGERGGGETEGRVKGI